MMTDLGGEKRIPLRMAHFSTTDSRKTRSAAVVAWMLPSSAKNRWLVRMERVATWGPCERMTRRSSMKWSKRIGDKEEP
jgi:hypothetical protein